VRRESEGATKQEQPARKTAIGFTKSNNNTGIARTIDFEIDQKAIIAKI
jgi:hypothetical protein